jgi:hypothetical protein
MRKSDFPREYFDFLANIREKEPKICALFDFFS